jgi:PAS domain S-box-containing protein
MSQAGRKSNQVAVEVRPDALDAAGTDRAHRLLSFVAERLSAPIAWFSVGDGRAERLVTSLGLEASVVWMLEGPMVEALREPEPFCVADTASDPRFRALARASSRGIRWIAGAPVRGRDGRRLGVLAVADSAPRGPAEPAEIELLGDFARAVAKVLEERTESPARPEEGGAVARARLDVLDRIASRAPLDDVAAALAAMLRTSDPGCLVHVLLCEGERLRSLASSGDHLPVASQRGKASDIGPAELVASLGRPVFVREVVAEERWPSWQRRALANGLTSASFVPALDPHGGVAAVLVVGRRAGPVGPESELTDEAVRLLAVAVDAQRAHAELHDSLSMASDLHCTCSLDGWIERANAAWERITGLPPTEVERRSFLDLVHADDQALVSERLEGAPADGRRVEFEARLRRSDGSPTPVRWSARRIVGRSTVVLSGRDVGHESTLERRLADKLARSSALRSLDAAIAGGTDLRQILSVVVATTRRILAVDAVGVLTYDPSARRLLPEVGEGFRAAYRPDVAAAIPLGEGAVGTAGLERRLVALDHLQGRGADEGFTVHLAVPAIARGELVGVVELLHRGPLPDAEACREVLEGVATKTAIALDAHTARRRWESSRLRIGMALDRTLEGWARALDVRAGDQPDHSRRLALLTVRLGRALGLDDARLEHVYRGALLHDVGEMFLPEGLLDKPGPLTPDELAIVAQHPAHARKVLGAIDVLADADVIPVHHHERWDGSGYPDGLVGEAIPVEARIFAVVDVYDALTHDRPHRPAWTPERAREHLREQAGRTLDPVVVAAFLGLDGVP